MFLPSCLRKRPTRIGESYCNACSRKRKNCGSRTTKKKTATRKRTPTESTSKKVEFCHARQRGRPLRPAPLADDDSALLLRRDRRVGDELRRPHLAALEV